jgi:hypothetical protein
MWVPVVVMIAGFQLYFVALLLIRTRGEILRRERNAQWVAEALGAGSAAPQPPSSGTGSSAFHDPSAHLAAR